MPYKHLPESPSLDHLKYQAKDLQKAARRGELQACQRVREFHPKFGRSTDQQIAAGPLTLADAQLAIAREYCFGSWAKLKEAIVTGDGNDQDKPFRDRIQDPQFQRAVDLLDAGDEAGLRELLQTNPQLVKQRVFFSIADYFGNPTLLEFTAENPIRNDRLPPNIVAIARIVIEAGAEDFGIKRTLGLVVSGKVPRECRVQAPLIDLLCDYGADPDAAMPAALTHGEFDAVEALIRRGAIITLPVAAATDRIAEAAKELDSASAEDRRRALALATQFGRTKIVSMLLEAGESPNGFNPVGCHSHSTPLHQAALYGHLDVVKLLVEHGADTSVTDVLYNGTPLGWARHDNRIEVVDYLQNVAPTAT